MQSIHNFRDFGGYPTRDGAAIKRGVLYRSGSMANACAADLEQLSSLNIRTVIDLRTEKEQERGPDRIPVTAQGHSVHLPIKVSNHIESGYLMHLGSLLKDGIRTFDFARAFIVAYQEYARDFVQEFSEVIRLASDEENLPILIHCTAGKDRTGFACSLIQLILGVPTDLVLYDYLLSNAHLDTFTDETLHRIRFLRFLGLTRERLMPLFEARREFIQAAWNQMNASFGGVQGYVEDGLGFSPVEQTNLRRLLLSHGETYAVSLTLPLTLEA